MLSDLIAGFLNLVKAEQISCCQTEVSCFEELMGLLTVLLRSQIAAILLKCLPGSLCW